MCIVSPALPIAQLLMAYSMHKQREKALEHLFLCTCCAMKPATHAVVVCACCTNMWYLRTLLQELCFVYETTWSNTPLHLAKNGQGILGYTKLGQGIPNLNTRSQTRLPLDFVYETAQSNTPLHLAKKGQWTPNLDRGYQTWLTLHFVYITTQDNRPLHLALPVQWHTVPSQQYQFCRHYQKQCYIKHSEWIY